MQTANDGIKKMKGYEDPALSSAFEVNQSNQGELEAAILGEKVTSHDIRKEKGKTRKNESIQFLFLRWKAIR